MDIKWTRNGKTITGRIIPKDTRVSPVFYGIFERIDGRYVQIRSRVYTSEKTAWLVFSDLIKNAPLSRSIRMVPRNKITLNQAEGITKGKRAHWNATRDDFSTFRDEEYRDRKCAAANDRG